MQNEKEKQLNSDAVDEVDDVDTGEERMRTEQITEERKEENRAETRNTRDENKNVNTETGAEEDFAPLFEDTDAEQFRTKWLDVQSRFVDDPSVAVKDADDLVADVIKNITRSFADKRIALEGQWKSGDVSTEDLRVALKRYRSFFNRLLTLES
ncbi:MAG TPA: hypothetical protein VKE92_09185 [Anaerolineales bacterium]|nr:hypothetical protein [Anaerolineales bacterium]